MVSLRLIGIEQDKRHWRNERSKFSDSDQGITPPHIHRCH